LHRHAWDCAIPDTNWEFAVTGVARRCIPTVAWSLLAYTVTTRICGLRAVRCTRTLLAFFTWLTFAICQRHERLARKPAPAAEELRRSAGTHVAAADRLRTVSPLAGRRHHPVIGACRTRAWATCPARMAWPTRTEGRGRPPPGVAVRDDRDQWQAIGLAAHAEPV
jgi:hypothetical protein